MNFKVTKQEGRTFIYLDGMLDSSSASQFQDIVAQTLQDETLDVVVDLSDLSYTSSQGIRVILTLIQGVMSRNGKLVFHNVRQAVKEILDMSGISQAMTFE